MFQKGPLVGCAWQDNKVVTVLSTTSQPVATGSVLRRQKNGTRMPVNCPDSIIIYNKYMGGVDRGDQIRGYYACRSKSRKFYKYIYHFLFDVAITNAFILHTNYTTSKSRNAKDFRLQLAKELIGTYCSRRIPGRSSGVPQILPVQHFPLICQEPTPAKRKRGRCAFCTQHSHKRSESRWKCNECDVWLCHDGRLQTDCFYLWHKNL